MKNVDLLIRAGADINHQDNRGNSPLLCAAFHNEYHIVLRLLEVGADYQIGNNRGKELAYMTIESSTRGGVGPDSDSEQGRDLTKVLAFLEKKGVSIDSVRKKVAEARERRGNRKGL